MKLLFDIGYHTIKLWMYLTKRQIEKTNGVKIDDFKITVSYFPVEEKTQILVNGEHCKND